MRLIVRCIVVLLFLLHDDLWAQCNTNPDFATYCGVEISKDGADGLTFADDCVPGWMPSHGSPQIQTPLITNPNRPPSPALNVAFMWSQHYPTDGIRGEGILAPFTFRKNRKYKVAIKYNVSLNYPDINSDGNFNLIAAQNVHRPSKWKTGNHLPATDRQQTIQNVPDITPGWTTLAYDFTANDDYNELWIYPYTNGYTQYNLYVDWVTVCSDECSDIIYYKQGVLPVAEPKAGSIFIGSSYGGSGTVTVSTTANTVVTAGREITISDEFETGVTTGSFLAQIMDACPDTLTPPVQYRPDADTLRDIDISQYPVETDTSTWTQEDLDEEYAGSGGRQAYPPKAAAPGDSSSQVRPGYPAILEEADRKTGLLIYPNPARNQLNMQFYSGRTGRISIRILNGVGVVVREMNSMSTAGVTKSIEFDIQTLPNGSYLVQVIDANGKVVIKKMLKLK